MGINKLIIIFGVFFFAGCSIDFGSQQQFSENEYIIGIWEAHIGLSDIVILFNSDKTGREMHYNSNELKSEYKFSWDYIGNNVYIYYDDGEDFNFYYYYGSDTFVNGSVTFTKNVEYGLIVGTWQCFDGRHKYVFSSNGRGTWYYNDYEVYNFSYRVNYGKVMLYYDFGFTEEFYYNGANSFTDRNDTYVRYF